MSTTLLAFPYRWALTTFLTIGSPFVAFSNALAAATSPDELVAAWSIEPAAPFGDEPLEVAVEFTEAVAAATAVLRISVLDPAPGEPHESDWVYVPLQWNSAANRYEGVADPVGRAAAVVLALLVTPTNSTYATLHDEIGSFTVGYARPEIESITPSSGSLQSIAQIAIHGSGFAFDVDTNSLEIQFGTTPVEKGSISLVGDDEIRVVPPATTSAGFAAVTLRLSKWGDELSVIAPSPYEYAGSVHIADFSPHGAPAGAPFELRLTGVRFSAAEEPRVRLGEYEATQIVIESDASLLARFEAIPAQDQPLAVEFSSDSDFAAIAGAFEIAKPRFRLLQSKTLAPTESLLAISQNGSPAYDFGAVTLLVDAGGVAPIVRNIATSMQPYFQSYFQDAEYPTYESARSLLAFGDYADGGDYDSFNNAWLVGIPNSSSVLDAPWSCGVVEVEGYFPLYLGIPNDSFGSSVHGLIDVNHDGYFESAAVGAPGSRRVAWIVANTWQGMAGEIALTVTAGSPEDGFGSNLGAGVDAQGRSYLAIGAPLASPNAVEHAGSVWLYRLPELEPHSAIPVSEIHLVRRFDFTEEHGTSMGGSNSMGLAVLPDLDGNGSPELLVGLPGVDNGRGSISVLDAHSNVELWRLDGLHAGDALGASITLARDFDRDGFPEFVVSAPGDDQNGVDAGSVSLVSSLDGSTLDRFTMNPGSRAGTQFLYSPDIDRDGMPEIVVASDPTASGASSIDRYGCDPRSETTKVLPGGGISSGILTGAGDRDGVTIDMKAGEEVRAVLASSHPNVWYCRFVAVDDQGEVLASNHGNPCYPFTGEWPSCPEHTMFDPSGPALRVQVAVDTTVHFLASSLQSDDVIHYHLKTERTNGKKVKYSPTLAATAGDWSEFVFHGEQWMRTTIELRWTKGHVDAIEWLAPDGTNLLETYPGALWIAPNKKGKGGKPIHARIGPKKSKYGPWMSLAADGEYRLRIRAPNHVAAKVKVEVELIRAISHTGPHDSD